MLTINEAGRLSNVDNQWQEVNAAILLQQLEQELHTMITLQLAELTHAVSQVHVSGQQNEAALQHLAVLEHRFRQMNAAEQQFAAFLVLPILHHPSQQQGEQAATVAGPNNQPNA